jgi:hypothetical protein
MDVIKDGWSLRAEKSALETKLARLEAALADVEKAAAQPGLAVPDAWNLQNKASLLQDHVTAVENRIATVKARMWWRSVDMTVSSVLGAGIVGSAWWITYPRYCVWRHRTMRPYTPPQIWLRRCVFNPHFPSPVDASAQRVPRRVNDFCWAMLMFYGAVNMYVGLTNVGIRRTNAPSSPPAASEMRPLH